MTAVGQTETSMSVHPAIWRLAQKTIGFIKLRIFKYFMIWQSASCLGGYYTRILLLATREWVH